jgi:hypothetical protein
MDAAAQQVSDLGEDNSGDEYVIGEALPPGTHSFMPGVVAVQESIERTGVGEDRQPSGSRQRSSSALSDVSRCPLANRPARLGSRFPRRPPDT